MNDARAWRPEVEGRLRGLRDEVAELAGRARSAGGAGPEQVRAGVVDALRRLRQAAHRAYPAPLAQRGLEAALRELQHGDGPAVRVDYTATGEPPPELALAVYDAVADALQGPAVSVHVAVAGNAGALDATIDVSGCAGPDRRRGIALGEAEERRSIERELHDGVQQKLIAAAMLLSSATGGPDAADLLDGAAADLRAMLLRRPPWMVGGVPFTECIRGAVRAYPVPVDFTYEVGALPPAAQATAYFFVSEALTNVVKHSGAAAARVRLTEAAGELRVEVSDDGRGGADPGRGSGLRGLAERLAHMGGRLEIRSTDGGGTTLVAHVPVA
ncbi:sensor histidine kinase [Dactylosporangium darangshiense]|uniref:histidine kinase n=1 Tax=Dactylosporangium darangshiense TaxID=579108 RepID=A0ABP8D8U2_9ACTN